MIIADHPLHGSGRAELPHPALALGSDAQPLPRIRVTDTGKRKPSSDVTSHAIPRQAMTLAAATKHYDSFIHYNSPVLTGARRSL
jgi:hypothetical protein